jgi:hypothetical protein
MNRFSANDLVRITAAGGGFKLDAGRFDVNDLVRIVAASKPGARIAISNTGRLSIDDLVRISAASKGSAFFEG